MRSRISKWGNSLAVRLPRAYTIEAGLADGDEVEIAVTDGKVVITPVARDYSLEDLVQGITPENRHTETDWGSPRGSEVW